LEPPVADLASNEPTKIHNETTPLNNGKTFTAKIN
jgi:hypothetical protein